MKTESAQKSNMYGMMPFICCIIFWVTQKHNSLPLGLIWAFISFYWGAPWVSCCVYKILQNNRDSSWRTMTKFVCQLGRCKSSSPSSKELHDLDHGTRSDLKVASNVRMAKIGFRWKNLFRLKILHAAVEVVVVALVVVVVVVVVVLVVVDVDSLKYVWKILSL